MQAVLLKCKPGAQFHLGKVANVVNASPDGNALVNTALNETADWIHSDTLFSALVNIVAGINPAGVSGFIAAFEKNVRISSAFYCLEEQGRRVFFLPKPAHYDQYAPSHDPKRFRHIQFVSLGVWESGAMPNKWSGAEYIVLQNQFIVTRAELSDTALDAARSLQVYYQRLLPRVDVRKPDRKESHFYSANICIADNSRILDDEGRAIVPDLRVHFYFLLETTPGFENDSAYADLKTAIQLLPDTGIGGERSVGCGGFEQVEFPVDFPQVRRGKSSAYATVSLCSPASADELSGFHSYETLLRGGRMTMHEGPLQLVRMIAEGAVSPDKPAGAIVDISPPNTQPDTAYFRLGKPLCLPVAF